MSGRPIRWTEYGVQLADGSVAPASTVDDVLRHPRPGVSRRVVCTPEGESGRAAIELGPWTAVPGGARRPA